MDTKSRICSKCGHDESQTKFGPTSGQDRHNHTQCRECINERTYAWRRKNPGWHLKDYLRRTYGISLEEYQVMVIAQDNRCAICLQIPNGVGKQNQRLHVDHDAITGKVRGLLCGNCNRAIGMLSHDSEIIQRAVDYLGHT
jgi:hypothetical protein